MLGRSPGFYIDLADLPGGLGGRVQLRVSTRWDDAGLEHPVPRELWMAVRPAAPPMDAAVLISFWDSRTEPEHA